MAEITYENVTKVFDGTQAVKDLNLEIHDGEFMVVVGPSGCGKTTALRMLAGLEEVTSGRILIDGREVNNVEPRDRDIAMVFQNYALYPHLSVYDNMAFGLKLRHTPKAEIDQRVREAASILQLDTLLDRKPRQLSGGQRQRVAMGRAIVRHPKAFLMDEPLSNLDAKLRVQMRAQIARLQRTLGVTTVYVTHDQVEAMTLGDRVAVMRSGVLQQVARPHEVYARPSNVFVAGFIGSPAMNMVEAELRQGPDGLRAAFGSQAIRVDEGELRARPGLRAYLGRRLILGIRPENMEDASLLSNADPASIIQAKVELREELGAEVDVHFAVDAPPVGVEDIAEAIGSEAAEARALAAATGKEKGEAGASTMFVARVAAQSEARAGQTMTLFVDPRALHFFDPETGQAIT